MGLQHNHYPINPIRLANTPNWQDRNAPVCPYCQCRTVSIRLGQHTMKYKFKTVDNSGEIEASDSRSAAQMVLGIGDWPEYLYGNRFPPYQPETFMGSRTKRIVRLYAQNQTIGESINLPEILKGIETEIILNALKLSGGNIAESATLLGIKRTTLQEKIKRHGIDR